MFDFTNQFEVTILTNGNVIDEYELDQNVYVEGRQGSPFNIILHNNSYERVYMIVSVDGLATTDGKPASTISSGYVIDSYSSYPINNWYDCKQFKFGDSRSFVPRTGKKTDHVGAIGVLVFREKPVVIHAFNTTQYDNTEWTPYQHHSVADSMRLSAGSASVNESLTFDNLLLNNAKIGSYDDFVKRDSANPDSFMTINYDSARGLEKRGIKLKYKTPHTNDPFPNSKAIRRK